MELPEDEPPDDIPPDEAVCIGFSIIITLFLDFLSVSIFTSFFEGVTSDDKSTFLFPSTLPSKSGSYLSAKGSVVVVGVTL